MISSERRFHKRIDYQIKADVNYHSTHAKGMIENVSETGIFKVVFSEKSVIDFYPGEILEINFILPSGQELNQKCKIIWARMKNETPLFLKYQMGVEIINPSPEYIEFVKDLLEKSQA